MEVLSRPKFSPRPLEELDHNSAPATSMLVAPSPVARSSPRLPSVDHKLTIPSRSSITSRRHSTTVGSISPSRLSRPLRSSPLAGPSIAATTEGPLAGAASAPPTPGGGFKHLSPLAEFSSTAAEEETRSLTDAETKKQRRRTLGAVFSKLSFPAATPGSSSEPSSPTGPAVQTRRRTKSTTSQEAPPVPPVPSWAHAHHTMPARTRSSLTSSAHAPSSASASTPASRTPGPSSAVSRPTSPTPSARSASSSVKTSSADPRRASFRPPPPSSSAEASWLTQSAAPRFSRLGLKAEGVILPVSAREARRRSSASLARSARTPDTQSLPPPPPLARSPSRGSTSSTGSLGSIAAPPPTPSRPSTAPAAQARFRSRASSRASLASAASGGSLGWCDTPSLTMSPGPSASDVSLPAAAAAGPDEWGALRTPGSRVEFQLNDVPVGVLPLPVPAYTGKGKERAADVRVCEAGAGAGADAWIRGAAASPAASIVDLSGGGAPALHRRAATAPEPELAPRTKRTHALGRVWRQVVRSVTPHSRRQ